jgi:UDP-3-O-[3-hydroxymyristoyl] N-acetylglucosamine deacetylase
MPTLREPIAVDGPALFTGLDARAILEPGDAGAGLMLAIADGQPFPARIENQTGDPVHPAFAGASARHTALRDPRTGRVAFTVEHALGALVGMGVTDAVVRVQAEAEHVELPIGDGSAIAFARAIDKCGLAGAPPAAPPPRTGEARAGAAYVRIAPADAWRYRLDYTDLLADHGWGAPTHSLGPLGPTIAHWTPGDRETFLRRVAPARTFSLDFEVEPLRKLGLFDRFTARDLLVVGKAGPIDNAWRFPDEPARHKLLDLLGDLALAGPFAGAAQADRAGHALNHEFARQIAAGG